ncbi:hypothetical protein [Fusarium graminearum mycovirus China 9]|uniref:C2H2-type domain-containing protein n=1 Tax=Fusarium graminearum mycovirus China 9 TaxID=941336 RepID=E7DDJ4_9VIRU|nr:hypothetical protein [Fusarium graminearum mycovirus China 9]
MYSHSSSSAQRAAVWAQQQRTVAFTAHQSNFTDVALGTPRHTMVAQPRNGVASRENHAQQWSDERIPTGPGYDLVNRFEMIADRELERAGLAEPRTTHYGEGAASSASSTTSARHSLFSVQPQSTTGCASSTNGESDDDGGYDYESDSSYDDDARSAGDDTLYNMRAHTQYQHELHEENLLDEADDYIHSAALTRSTPPLWLADTYPITEPAIEARYDVYYDQYHSVTTPIYPGPGATLHEDLVLDARPFVCHKPLTQPAPIASRTGSLEYQLELQVAAMAAGDTDLVVNMIKLERSSSPASPQDRQSRHGENQVAEASGHRHPLPDLACPICFEPQRSRRSLAAHRSSSHPKQVCGQAHCSYTTDVPADFAFHMDEEHPVLGCDSTGCDYTTRSSQLHWTHMVGHLSCTVCGLLSANLAAAADHIREHAGKWSCSLCNEPFEDAFSLNEHNQDVHFTCCTQCEAIVRDKNELLDHCHDVHPYLRCREVGCAFRTFEPPELAAHHDWHDQYPLSFFVVKLQCPDLGCTHAASSHEMAALHYNTHLQKPNYACESCDAWCHSHTALIRHSRMHKQVEQNLREQPALQQAPATASGDVCKCPHCAFTSKSKVEWQDHININHRSSQHLALPCSLCGKVFTGVNAVRKHHCHKRDWHDKPHRCGKCNARFGQSRDLERHKATHEAARPRHQCQVCHETFARLDHLQRHVRRRHSRMHKQVEQNLREQPALQQAPATASGDVYKCPHCAFTSKSKVEWQDHININHRSSQHLALPCSLCGKVFTGVNAVRKHHCHKRDWHDKPHRCDKCNARFGQSRDLERHKATHEADRPRHQCQVCHETFARLDHLQRHVRRRHT